MSNRDFVVCSLCYPGVPTVGDSEEGDGGVTIHERQGTPSTCPAGIDEGHSQHLASSLCFYFKVARQACRLG